MHALEPILEPAYMYMYLYIKMSQSNIAVPCNNLSAILYFQYGWTALLWACDNSHADVVDYLLQHGPDVDAQDVSLHESADNPLPLV